MGNAQCESYGVTVTSTKISEEGLGPGAHERTVCDVIRMKPRCSRDPKKMKLPGIRLSAKRSLRQCIDSVQVRNHVGCNQQGHRGRATQAPGSGCGATGFNICPAEFCLTLDRFLCIPLFFPFGMCVFTLLEVFNTQWLSPKICLKSQGEL